LPVKPHIDPASQVISRIARYDVSARSENSLLIVASCETIRDGLSAMTDSSSSGLGDVVERGFIANLDSRHWSVLTAIIEDFRTGTNGLKLFDFACRKERGEKDYPEKANNKGLSYNKYTL